MATPAPTTTVADNSAFGGPNAAQAAAANAALAQTSNPTATSGNTVPTTAPAGQTSTTAPQATPTTVVSSQPAVAQVGQMQNTLTQAQQDLANQQSIKAANAANEKARLVPTGSSTSSTFITPTPPAQKTPEQQIADTPDTGNQWVYNVQGAQSQIPIGSTIPPGYSITNPTTGPTSAVADTTTDPIGNVYKQFSDGTYGKFNPMGAYVGQVSSSQFNASKQGETQLNALAQLANGSYPLSPSEQAQVDAIGQQLKSAIAAQQIANANLTGGTSISMARGGEGLQIAGQAEVSQTITNGIQKIQDLQTAAAAAVAKLESAFRSDDIAAMSAAYNAYSSTIKDRQTELDTMQAAADAKVKAAQDSAEQIRQFNIQEQDKVTAAIDTTATDAAKGGAPAQVLASIKAAKNNTDAIVAAGQYLEASTNPDVAQYLAYRTSATAAGQTPVPFESWQNTRDYNKAFLTAKGDAAGKAAGTPVDTSTGSFTQSANTKSDIPAALRPYANKSASGAWYLDLSSASAASRAKLAAMAGADVSVITDKNQAADLKNQEDAISKLNIIGKVMADITNTSAASRDLGGAGLTQASILAQTDPKAAAALALNDSALDILKAISGVQGFRGNKEAIDQIKAALPKPTDTQDVAAQKLSLVAQQIQAREQAVLGGNLGPNNYTNFVIRTEDQSKSALVNASKQDTNTATQVTNILKTTNPSTGQPYTYTEAAQILGIDVPGGSTGGGNGGIDLSFGLSSPSWWNSNK